MKNRWHCLITAGITLAWVVAAARGEPPPTTAPAKNAESHLTVAVLDFSAADANVPDLGPIIGQTVSIMLSDEPEFQLVDRTAIDRVLQEQELNLTGLVETDQAIKVGKLVGARIIVVGKAFQLGQKLFITAKLIGTETTLVDGVLVKGDASDPIDELVMKLATDIAARLREAGPKLVASTDTTNPVPALKEALAGLPLPTIALVITEEHITQRETPPATQDPAVETEVKHLLIECGVTVQDIEGNELLDWARARRNGDKDPIPWPNDLAIADWVVAGEAFSEFGAQLGNLHSCTARAEINVIDRRTGRIVYADRETARAVDLSENLAGRTALEKAGRKLGIRLLERLRSVSNASPASQPATRSDQP